jgi:phosphohistidine swiveling domain-containing protein
MRQSINQAHYIFNLKSNHIPLTVGNKAYNLHQLLKKKFLVPVTYACTWQAYDDFLINGDGIFHQLRSELNRIIDPGKSYAVRSSANIEDSLEQSFAGQFNTLLDVRGVDQVLQAIREIWEDAQKEAIKTYIGKGNGSAKALKMAVIIQEMVAPKVSGVAFSKNPITTLDEIIVEAVPGYGIALVQGGHTPARWVNKWGGWISKPDDGQISLDLIQDVVDQTKRIAKAFKKEIDLEWVYDGEKLYWVQLRDITSIKDAVFYSNRMAKEMTPGQVKPLVWSVTIPNPSSAWVELLTEVIGKNDLDARRLTRAFHYRAYHNMAEFGKVFEGLGLPRESLEMMLGVLPPGAGKPPMKPGMKTMVSLPRLVGFMVNKWRIPGKLDEDYPRLFAETREFSVTPSTLGLSERQLIAEIDKIQKVNRQLVYYTIVSIMSMLVYTGMLRSRLKKVGIEFQNFDLTKGMDELNVYDPGQSLKILHEKYVVADPATQEIIQSGDYEAFLQSDLSAEFRNAYDDCMERFGHLSDATGHFGCPAWRENPGLVLKLIASYDPPKDDLHSRVSFDDLPKKSGMLKTFYKRARMFRLYREKFSSLYSYSLMLFRGYYLAIGEIWAGKGLIATPEDILYLYDDEVRACIAGQIDGKDFAQKIDRHKVALEQSKDAVLPEVIFGEEIPLMVASTSDKLVGTPTSKGYYTGPVRVVRSVEEFEKPKEGDVLVIPYSDVSWTPLFAKAGAVIAESGGILSHSSIIAREYNIPAVVSVSGALSLVDDTIVTVNGFKGEILIHEQVLDKPPVVEEVNQGLPL